MRSVPGREMVVIRGRRWWWLLVFNILWPVLLRILLAMSILCHALRRRRQEEEKRRDSEEVCRQLKSRKVNGSRTSSQFPIVEEKAKGHLVSPGCREREREVESQPRKQDSRGVPRTASKGGREKRC